MIAQTTNQPNMIEPVTQNPLDFNVASYLVSEIPNAVRGVNGYVEKVYDSYGNLIKPLANVPCEKELRTKRMIIHDLLTNNYDSDKYNFYNEKNNKYVKDVFDMIASLPKLDVISQTKPYEATFDEIPVRKTDNGETKKFLRKMNVRFIGYHCDHNAINEKCDKVVMSTSDLLESKEFKKYKEFIDIYVYCVYQVFVYYWYDIENNTMNEALRTRVPNDFHIDYSKLMKMRCLIGSLNAKIYSINSSSNKRCSKCESMQKLFDYTLREVQRMREEQEEQEQLDRQFDETDYDLTKFMKDNYPSIDRFLLKDVQQKYLKQFGQKLTFGELQERIEETGLFKVTNVHRTLYVNRL